MRKYRVSVTSVIGVYPGAVNDWEKHEEEMDKRLKELDKKLRKEVKHVK